MTDRNTKATGAPQLRLLVNQDFNDPAKLLADKLEAEYASRARQSGNNFASCIDVPDYPDDKIVQRTVAILGERGFNVDPVEYNCAGGRAGAFWLTPADPNRKF